MVCVIIVSRDLQLHIREAGCSYETKHQQKK